VTPSLRSRLRLALQNALLAAAAALAMPMPGVAAPLRVAVAPETDEVVGTVLHMDPGLRRDDTLQRTFATAGARSRWASGMSLPSKGRR
jgi:hypothetical protein